MIKEFPSQLWLPRTTICAKDSILSLHKQVEEFGHKGVIVHGSSFAASGRLESVLNTFSKETRPYTIQVEKCEPTNSGLREIIKKLRSYNAKWVAGIGGGSVIDIAKAAAGLFNAENDPSWYQDGNNVESHGLPFICVPTVPGTGAETTLNAVITNEDKQLKLSIRHASFLAQTVILDPSLLYGVPARVLQYAGVDCFVQAYESYISKNATEFTRMLSLRALMLVYYNLPLATINGNDESYSALLTASYYGGIALMHARLGVIHGIAHKLGVLYHQPHGLVCGVCMPASIELNREAMGNSYSELSSVTGGDFFKQTINFLEVNNILNPFKGQKIISRDGIIRDTLSSGSTAANPKKVTAQDIEFILENIF